MELTPEDVQEILRILEQSSFDELYLETPQLKLIVRRGQPQVEPAGAPSRLPEVGPPSPDSAVPARETGEMAALTAESPEAPSTSEAQSPAAPTQAALDELIPIVAPMKGIFYRAPRPGAPLFVEVGSHVQEDTVVAIIEVMKLMNSIQAGVRGTIVQVCVDNGEAVERGQALFLIRPDSREST